MYTIVGADATPNPKDLCADAIENKHFKARPPPTFHAKHYMTGARTLCNSNKSTPRIIDRRDLTPPSFRASGDTEFQRHHLVVGGWWCIAAIGPCIHVQTCSNMSCRARVCSNMSCSNMSCSNMACSNMHVRTCHGMFEGREAGRKIAEPQH